MTTILETLEIINRFHRYTVYLNTLPADLWRLHLTDGIDYFKAVGCTAWAENYQILLEAWCARAPRMPYASYANTDGDDDILLKTACSMPENWNAGSSTKSSFSNGYFRAV